MSSQECFSEKANAVDHLINNEVEVKEVDPIRLEREALQAANAESLQRKRELKEARHIKKRTREEQKQDRKNNSNLASSSSSAGSRSSAGSSNKKSGAGTRSSKDSMLVAQSLAEADAQAKGAADAKRDMRQEAEDRKKAEEEEAQLQKELKKWDAKTHVNTNFEWALEEGLSLKKRIIVGTKLRNIALALIALYMLLSFKNVVVDWVMEGYLPLSEDIIKAVKEIRTLYYQEWNERDFRWLSTLPDGRRLYRLYLLEDVIFSVVTFMKWQFEYVTLTILVSILGSVAMFIINRRLTKLVANRLRGLLAWVWQSKYVRNFVFIFNLILWLAIVVAVVLRVWHDNQPRRDNLWDLVREKLLPVFGEHMALLGARVLVTIYSIYTTLIPWCRMFTLFSKVFVVWALLRWTIWVGVGPVHTLNVRFGRRQRYHKAHDARSVVDRAGKMQSGSNLIRVHVVHDVSWYFLPFSSPTNCYSYNGRIIYELLTLASHPRFDVPGAQKQDHIRRILDLGKVMGLLNVPHVDLIQDDPVKRTISLALSISACNRDQFNKNLARNPLLSDYIGEGISAQGF